MRVASYPNGGIVVTHQADLGMSGKTGHSVAWDESDAAAGTKDTTVNIPDRSNPVAKLARLDLNIVDPAAAYYDRVNLELYSDDAMYAGNDRHYLECGASGLQVVLAALQLGRHGTPSNILDFGSGAGRVTRWLRARFPSACIDCTDIRIADLDFCHEQFCTNAWVSGTDTQQLGLPRAYDLIWAGSVLTHLPEANTRKLLGAFVRWLRPNGVAVFSSHGRYATGRQESGQFTYIDEAPFRCARDGYLASGYGYSDYPGQVGIRYIFHRFVVVREDFE